MPPLCLTALDLRIDSRVGSITCRALVPLRDLALLCVRVAEITLPMIAPAVGLSFYMHGELRHGLWIHRSSIFVPWATARVRGVYCFC
jgi:hypothetical protein